MVYGLEIEIYNTFHGEPSSSDSIMNKGRIMGLFDVDDDKLRALYHRAWHESGRGAVNTRKYPYLDKALTVYAKEHGCSYDEALILAKTGKKTGRLEK